MHQGTTAEDSRYVVLHTLAVILNKKLVCGYYW
jgi:hypothetical protein